MGPDIPAKVLPSAHTEAAVPGEVNALEAISA
jgi:hypothetical protein